MINGKWVSRAKAVVYCALLLTVLTGFFYGRELGSRGGDATMDKGTAGKQVEELRPDRYTKQCSPNKFDGRCLYHATWQAFLESDLALAGNSELRAEFMKWERKFDNTGDLDCPDATAENRFTCPSADRAIRMMRNVLKGPFDYYFDPYETALAEQNARSDIEGIGARVEVRNSAELLKSLKVASEEQARKALIIGPEHELVVGEDPSPEAGAAGILKKGDVLVAVKEADALGEPTRVEGLTLDDAVSKIRGKSDSKVDVTFDRTDEQGQVGRQTVTITRKHIVLHAVSVQERGNKAVITVKNFDMDNMDEDTVQALDEAQKKNDGIVIDLRNNPGGKLPNALLVLDALQLRGSLYARMDRIFNEDALLLQEVFLEPGFTVNVQRRSDEAHPRVSLGKRSGLLVEPEKPVRVLINGGSASASEVVAGGLQANGRAKVMGAVLSGSDAIVRSHGKDQGQRSIPLPYNRMARIPIFTYLPGGIKMPGGLVADIQVPVTEEDIKAGRDSLLDAALASIDQELAEKKVFAERAKKAKGESERSMEMELCMRSKVDELPVGQSVTDDMLRACGVPVAAPDGDSK